MTPEDRLSHLLERWHALAAQGHVPSVTELCSDCPELADEFQRRLAEARATPPLSLAPATVAPTDHVTAAESVESAFPYVILEELGRGGMGVVYKARQVKLNRIVALKMILSGDHAGSAEVARLRTEAEAVARLKDPHVVQIHDVGEHEGKTYLALEFCDGGSLDQRLKGTPMKAEDSAKLVRMLADGVEAAHRAGVIHRDLKPANVLLTEDGTPKVSDFGLAKLTDSAGHTQSGAVMGTPSYMPPEQAKGAKDLGPTADVYSLGAILYECLTGRPPFRAATAVETLALVVGEEPVPPSRLAKVPRDLETVCLKCLEKEPAKRYASAAELAADLERHLRGEPVQARPVGRVERAWRWARREPVVAGLLAAVLLTFAVGATVATWFGIEASWQADAARKAAGREKNKAEEAKRNEDRAVDQEKQGREQKERGDHQRDLAELRLYAGQLARAQAEWEHGNQALAMELLDNCQWNLRHVEHRHLWTLFNSNQKTFRGHTNSVSSVAYSPDGKRILTGSHDNTAKVWDAEKGQEVLSLKGHTHIVSSVAFSPDGKRAFAWDDKNKVLAWSLADGKPVAPTDPPAKPAAGPALSPNGRLSAKPDGNRVAVTDLLHPPPPDAPWPLPDLAERTRYHTAEADLAAKQKQHFAAAFHLGRLLLDAPNDVALKKRREQALKNHADAIAPSKMPSVGKDE